MGLLKLDEILVFDHSNDSSIAKTCNKIEIYCTLTKEGPWAVHLTLGQDWGMG